jgi:ribosomal protein S18 acetylase RimI-like enzyme
MAVSAAKAMWSMIQEVLFGPKPEPPPQLRKPDPPVIPPTTLSHVICGHGPARDMMIDEMISWLADVGPEYTSRTLNNFISVQIGEANLMYVTKNGQVVGFAVFRIAYKKVYLDRIAVAPEHRRCGAGRYLLSVIRDTLTPYRETAIVNVPANCLDAQLFFKRCGWKATKEKDGRIRFEVKFRGEVESPKLS